MRAPLAFALALALAATAAGAPAGATDSDRGLGGRADLSGAPRALASNGTVVLMPGIEGLGCRDIVEVLALIDRAGYRGALPLPEDHPDRAIFDYEHRLARVYFNDCIRNGHGLDEPGPAFRQGFRP